MPFRYRKFRVYQQARSLRKEIFLLISLWEGPSHYLVDQVKRSSLSVMLNIAEGSSKQSDKDFNRYITIALGSIDEVVASLEVALDLNLINEETFDAFEVKLESLCNQLGSFSKTLKSK